MDGKCALRAIRHDCAKRAQHTVRFSILFHIIFKTKHTKKFELKRKWRNLRALELMKRSFFIPYFCIRLCFHSVLRTFFVFSLQKWCFSALCVANIGYSFLHVSQFTICPSTDAGRTHSKWCIKYFVRSCGLQAAYFYFFAHAIRIDLMATRTTTTTTAIKIGVEWTDNFRTFLDYFSSFHHCHVCASVACRNEIRDYESYSLFFFSFPLQALLVRPYLRHRSTEWHWHFGVCCAVVVKWSECVHYARSVLFYYDCATVLNKSRGCKEFTNHDIVYRPTGIQSIPFHWWSNIMSMADGRLRPQLIISRLYFIIFTLCRPCSPCSTSNFCETNEKKLLYYFAITYPPWLHERNAVHDVDAVDIIIFRNDIFKWAPSVLCVVNLYFMIIIMDERVGRLTKKDCKRPRSAILVARINV